MLVTRSFQPILQRELLPAAVGRRARLILTLACGHVVRRKASHIDIHQRRANCPVCAKQWQRARGTRAEDLKNRVPL